MSNFDEVYFGQHILDIETVEKQMTAIGTHFLNLKFQVCAPERGIISNMLERGAKVVSGQPLATLETTENMLVRHKLEEEKLAAQTKLEHEALEAQAQRDHEREMAIIANETARENRLRDEARAKIIATAKQQDMQSIEGLLKGLQGNGEG